MRTDARRLAAILGTSALMLAGSAGTALANGRFPESNKIFFAPNDPDTVLLRVTFGLLVSHDHGRTWDWVCEQSVGYTGNEDPMYAVGPGGTIFSTTFLGLSVSRDRACTFGFEKGELQGKLFIDLSQRTNDTKSVVFFSSAYEGQNDAGEISFSSSVFETTDEGQTYTKLPGAIDPSILGETVDVAASDPDRLYLSGVKQQGTGPKGYVLASRDHGKTWASVEIPLEAEERSIFIGGVDPKNADRVYVRTSAPDDKSTRLLVSDDGAKTFRVAFTGKGALRGFAVSPDGSRVWVGGPLDELATASSTDLAFAPVGATVPSRDAGAPTPVRIQCLTATTEGLWACSNEPSGFIAGFSADGGKTFEPRVRFCEIRGPLACAEGTTTHTQCVLGGAEEPRRAPWPIQRAGLGCGNVSADGGVTGDAGTGAAPEDPGEDGCTCRAAGRPSWGLLAGTIGALAIMARRTRRRRAPSRTQGE